MNSPEKVMKRILTKYAIYQINDVFRQELSKYTKKAYQYLPKLQSSKILDVGCGTGVPTLQLAQLNTGEILGIDVNQFAIDWLNKKILKNGLSERVKTRNCSITNMEFKDQSFDIIWSEGSIYKIGFLNGLKKWRHLLKNGGFLVVHDRIIGKKKDLEKISQLGYKLISQFELPKDSWRKEYFEPLEKELKKIYVTVTDKEVLQEIEKFQNEIDSLKADPKGCYSGFYIMQKI
jgi:ubiquinone/menaquinone biosynthesis C-methylase UbiE